MKWESLGNEVKTAEENKVHQTHHLVHPEAVIELQSRNVVGLLKIVNHKELSIVQTSCALEELLETFLEEKKNNSGHNFIIFFKVNIDCDKRISNINVPA